MWLALLLLFPVFSFSAAPPLSALSVNLSTIAVSGFSSGGCFANQFHAAFSATVSGMGSFSGCPYLSGSVGFNLSEIVTETKELSSRGLIDSVDNLLGDRVYIFQGHADEITPYEAAAMIHNFYSEFGLLEEEIEEKSDLWATHGFPSDSYGCPCDTFCPNFYINNCNYSGAGAVLEQTLPAMLTNSVEMREEGSLDQFDQQEFFENRAEDVSMDSTGYIYIPERCKSATCNLHMHFHGCGMGRFFIDDNYIRNSGMMETADLYDVILLLPQAQPLYWTGNTAGCWDYWGYLYEGGHTYATKAGLQMSGVSQMLRRVAGVQV